MGAALHQSSHIVQDILRDWVDGFRLFTASGLWAWNSHPT